MPAKKKSPVRRQRPGCVPAPLATPTLYLRVIFLPKAEKILVFAPRTLTADHGQLPAPRSACQLRLSCPHLDHQATRLQSMFGIPGITVARWMEVIDTVYSQIGSKLKVMTFTVQPDLIWVSNA